MSLKPLFSLVATVAFGLGLCACATPKRLPATPVQAGAQAQPSVSNVRFLVARDAQSFAREAEASLAREQAWRSAQGLTGPLPPTYFLAISGGGDKGAFGAGLLNGWTQAGTRPEFKVV